MTTLIQIFDAQGSLRMGDACESLKEALYIIEDDWDSETSAVAIIVMRVPGPGEEMVRVYVSQDGTNWAENVCAA